MTQRNLELTNTELPSACTSSAFARSGLARLSDLWTAEWTATLAGLNAISGEFEALAERFLDPDYPAPRDPLHTWSRIWEYPYVFANIVESGVTSTRPGGRPALVLDLGSAVTFMPFALARRGLDVFCADSDPLMGRRLATAISQVPHAPGSVSFTNTDGMRLRFADESIDAIYCISVLEHVPQPAPLIHELFRVLRPGGSLILTIDLDLRGDHELTPAHYYPLKQLLTDLFAYLHTDRTIHPRDILTSLDGPFGYRRRSFMPRLAQKVRNVISRRPLSPEPPYYCAVEGLSLRKPAHPGSLP